MKWNCVSVVTIVGSKCQDWISFSVAGYSACYMGHTFASDKTLWRIPARCFMEREGARRKVQEILSIQ